MKNIVAVVVFMALVLSSCSSDVHKEEDAVPTPPDTTPPVLYSIDENTISNGETFIIQGTGFGEKTTAAPFRSSYDNPAAGMNFQQTGSIDSSWSIAGDVMVTLQSTMRRLLDRQYIRLEYSSRGNWGHPESGYSAGLQTVLPMTGVNYVAFWEYIPSETDFSLMETGAVNIKYLYFAPGQQPHEAIGVSGGGSRMFASVEVAGATNEEQNANLDLPFGGGFYARPESFSANYALPRDEWYFVEVIYHMNSRYNAYDGMCEFKVNNQIIYKAINGRIITESTDGPDFSYLRFGGNYGWYGEDQVFYRYYGDIYVDGTLARIALGDEPVYDDCIHLELQVPHVWTDTQIEITVNQGSFTSGDTAWLFAIDAAGNVSDGLEIVFE